MVHRILLSGAFSLVIMVLCAQNPSAEYQASIEAFRAKQEQKLSEGPRAPLAKKQLAGLRYYPINEQFRFECMMLPLADSDPVQFPTSDGQQRAYRPYAKLLFRYGTDLETGKELLHELTVYEMQGSNLNPLYADHLFLPFLDKSNSFGSYGGGRYIDLSRKALESGDYTLDFNRAYNPWCSYSPNFSCPIPPENNRLSFEVLAGEADFEEKAGKQKLH